MSTAPPNTQQASFTTSRGGKHPRGSSGARASSSVEEAAEFKALRSKHSSSLRTLNEMFPDWTDADLLSAIKEADGNLETTIAHIAEGFASQWGEVKSRKEKRQVTKQQHDESKVVERSSHVPPPASFRAGVRGGAVRRGGRGSYSNTTGGYSNTSGSRVRTASAASKPAASVADDVSGWEVIDSTGDKNATGAWESKPAAQEPKAKSQAAAAAVVNTAPAKPAPVSWASIAKRGVKQTVSEPAKAAEQVGEPVESVQPVPEELATNENELATETSAVEPVIADDLERAEAAPSATVAVAEEEITSANVVEDKVVAEPSSEHPSSLHEAESQALDASAEDSQQPASLASKRSLTNARRLHQDAPVVMPLAGTTLERIGMQFGSLSIGGVDLPTLIPAAPAAAPAAPPAEAKEAPATPAATPVKAEAAVAPAPAPASVPARAAELPSASTQGPLTAYLQQQQQQQQQQHHAQNHAQPNVSAISQMPLPNDYGAAALYGAEAQRNVMGFYDNYGYGQYVGGKDATASASAAAAVSSADAQSLAASGAQAAGINGSANIAQAGLFPQQIPQPFGMSHGMPYYNPYYYNMMQPGSQFPNPAFGNNPAIAAAYGQPFMKQGIYPMYPGATPQGLQAAGAQPQQAHPQPHQPGQPPQQQQQQQQQQPSASQQQQQPGQQPQQGQAGGQQPSSQQQHQHQHQHQQGAKGSAVGSQGGVPYGNINAQKAANPYGHYAANIGAGFGVYDQDPAALSSSPQQFGLGGIPGIFSAAKAGGAKDAGAKGIPPTGGAPVIGGTTYYNTPQQHGGYPSQVNSSHPQGYSHHQQPYYNPYAQNYSQTQTPHMYQQQPQHHQHHHHAQQQQQQQPPQAGHQQQPNKQYWEKQ